MKYDLSRLLEKCQHADFAAFLESKTFVYFLFFRGAVVYIGKTNSVAGRVAGHISQGNKLFDRVSWFEVAEEDAPEIERVLIRALDPKHNTKHRESLRRKIEGRDREVLESLGLTITQHGWLERKAS